MRSASCCLPPSIRERIEPEPVADAAPEIGKAVGLENEEEHDGEAEDGHLERDRKSTRLNSSHLVISYAVFCLKKKTKLPFTIHYPPQRLFSLERSSP